jgi:predicted nuclease with TOPRIM domain
MIGIRCKACNEVVGSVNRRTMLCERCGLKAENAQAGKYARKVNEEIAKLRKENAELKANWGKLRERIEKIKIEAIRFTEKDRKAIPNEETFAMLSSTVWLSRNALIKELEKKVK